MPYAEFNILEATVIGIARSGVNTKTFELVNPLDNGNYTVYSVWINSCHTLAGEVSDGLDLSIKDGLAVILPSQNPTHIIATCLIGGDFKIEWEYFNLDTTDIRPSEFYIYGDSVQIGTATYQSNFSHFAFETSENYKHNQEVEISVKAVLGIAIKDNDDFISGIADSKGPDITVDEEEIELI